MIPTRFGPTIAALLAVLLGAHSPAPTVEGAEEITAFVHVHLLPMDGEEVLQDQTVVVIGDRIHETGPSADVRVPTGARVIEGEGLFLMPGLADMHAHYTGNEALLLFVAYGVTTIRNMWGDPSVLAARGLVASELILGPTIYTTGPGIDGDPPLWPESVIVTTPEGAELEVLAEKAAGYDAIKIFTNLQPDVYTALLLAATKHGLPVYGHVPTRVGLRRALPLGQRSFEHMTDFVYALLPEGSPIRAGIVAGYEELDRRSIYEGPFRAASPAGSGELATGVAATGTWFCPTLVLTKKMAADSAELASLRREPYLSYVQPMLRQYWEAKSDTLLADLGVLQAMRMGLAIEKEGVLALHRSGVRLLVGTDTPNPYVLPGLAVHEELEQLVDAGLSPYEALRAATAGPADFLEASGDFGRVGNGLRADLILLERNPFEDITATRRQVGVMARGRWYSARDLTERLRALADRYGREATPSNPDSVPIPRGDTEIR